MEKYTEFYGLEGLAWRALGEIYGHGSDVFSSDESELGYPVAGFEEEDAEGEGESEPAYSFTPPMCKESKRGANPALHMLVLNRPFSITRMRNGR